MPKAPVTAHFRTLRQGQKGGFLNFELTRKEAVEWINILTVGLMEERSNTLHFIVHDDMPVQTCQRGSCDGNAQGDFVYVRRG